MTPKNFLASAFATVVATALLAGTAVTQTDLPVLSRETPRGTGTVTVIGSTAPTAKTADGLISDWTGAPSRFGGTVVYSAGELIYQDHLFDAYGPDDGGDARRLSVLDPLNEGVPETYRLDAILKADILGQVDPTSSPGLKGETNYGDLPHQDHADLEELRVAFDSTGLWVLARTTTMTATAPTALLLLVDLHPDSGAVRQIPFNSGLTTRAADVAVLLSRGGGRVANLANGKITALPQGVVTVNEEGYINIIEAGIPSEQLARAGGGAVNAGHFSLAAATGTAAPGGDQFTNLGLGANLANVAFRLNEPVREWFEKRQALALYHRSIDQFFLPIETDKLAAGVNEIFVPGYGYHDRVFVSSERVSEEKGADGIFQHYGLFLPSSYRAGAPSPLQLWLHWRGGKAHSAGALTPRVFRHLGEDQSTIVVSPRGRGTARWYVGKGQVDFLEVWQNVFESFTVDENRVYASGHSMGGWGSYLLPILYPDRFAAAMPVAAPVTQGAWTGIDFQNCDEFDYEEYTPCYVSANGGDPRVQHTRRLLDNLRHVPYAIYHGTLDQLVPYTGVARQVERFVGLGYRHRFYTFPTYEHYSHPLVDEWAEGARYMHGFVRDPNPARVTYVRDMPFERATETVQSDAVALDFDFDSAYWMSELTPVDEHDGVARFDGRTLAVRDPRVILIPEVGAGPSPGQTGPYAMTGMAWLEDITAPAPETSNGFDVSLAGARAVRLDLARMRIDSAQFIRGTITAEAQLELRLDGGWTSPPPVTVNGQPAAAALVDGVLIVSLPAGSSSLTIN